MVLRQRLMEQMESRMQVEDEELRDLIDMAILEAAEGAYLPLKERLCLRKELFDSFRRLDILQELVDDPTNLGDHGKWHGAHFCRAAGACGRVRKAL